MPKVKMKITKFLFFYVKGELVIEGTVAEINEINKNVKLKVS